MLYFLTALLGFQVAHADQLFDVLQRSKDSLVADGYSSTQSDGVNTYSKDFGDGKFRIILSKNNEYVADRASMGDTSSNYARLEQLDGNGKMAATTLCTGYGQGASKFICRTQTASYCKALTSNISGGIFASDIRKLQECSSILDKIKFDVKELNSANGKAMGIITSKLRVPCGEVKNPVGAPTSIQDLLEDYAGCKVAQ
jgi:hypothetical protein